MSKKEEEKNDKKIPIKIKGQSGREAAHDMSRKQERKERRDEHKPREGE